ncbi:MAG TPA: PilZ domain-containing protein [Sphingomonas sp.]|uniref:PilZ domain-containing protein n=1 Tax=Sphingomonas sp. TaxID=28214 RepID=UPI002ED7B858
MPDRFDPECDLAAEAALHQRIAARDSMFLQARVIRADGSDVALRVRNLSAGGMMAESEQPFVKDERVTVELRSVGMVGARIAWINAPRFGVAFDRPIDPKLARKAPAQSPGTNLTLLTPTGKLWRPGLK